MTDLLRSLRTELRYQTWSKLLLLPFAVTLLSLGAAFSGSISNAAFTLDRLHLTTTQAAANGVSLSEALAQPVNVSIQAGQKFSDNPLRADYEAAYNAQHALDGFNAIGSGLEMITFIVLPLLFFIYGSAVAVNDVRQRILKQRVSAQGPVPYVAAKVLVVMAVAVASVLLCGALSLAAAPVLKGAFYPHAQFDFPFAVETPGGGNAILQMAFSAGTAIFFGLLGFFVGLATRVMLLPALLAGGLLMVAPFAGPYDPRNVLSVAAEGVFDFWGGFTPRALYPVSSGVGLLLMLIGFCIVAAACAVVWSRRTKFV